ncbi:MAG TPA: hypothetical protein VHL34_18230 [Rhizomicrobium sp.]|jgi:hypothetical protein|nr:hypothetical protein [Rhizomicrobium sp.]
MRATITTVVFLATAITLTGCGRSDEKTVTTSDGSTVTAKTEGDGSASYVAKSADGKTTVSMGTGAQANTKTPAYAPLFPGATVETSVNAGGENAGGMVMFKTNATAASVIDFYKKSTAASGMSNVLDMTSGDSMSYSAKDEKTNHAVTVVATKADGATNVQLTWSDHG